MLNESIKRKLPFGSQVCQMFVLGELPRCLSKTMQNHVSQLGYAFISQSIGDKLINPEIGGLYIHYKDFL